MSSTLYSIYMTTDRKTFFKSSANRLDEIISDETQLLQEVMDMAAGLGSEGTTYEGRRHLDRLADKTAALGELALSQAARLRSLNLPVNQQDELPKDRDVRKAVRYISVLPDYAPFDAQEAGLDPKILDAKAADITNYFQQERGQVLFVRVPTDQGVSRDTFALGQLNPGN